MAMRVLAAVGLTILFGIGAVLGVVIGIVIFPISLYRGARAVHAEGVICRAQLVARDTAGQRIAGPALVRLSGAFEGQTTAKSDVLGVAIRMQRAAIDDARDGDQDLVFGSFESFHTAGRDRANTNTGDYLANPYSTVTPWWLPGNGPVVMRLAPPPALPAARGTDRRSQIAGGGDPDGTAGGAGGLPRGIDRMARLDADLAAGTARFTITIDRGSARVAIAELELVARLAIDDSRLRISMFRQGRGVRPLGLRNGIRATVYPMSQTARRLRGR